MNRASSLAAEAWTLLQAGSVDKAISRYREAIAVADPEVNDLWQIHGELGSALAQAGQYDEAIAEHKRSIQSALSKGEGDDSSMVQVARHFAATLLLLIEKPQEALSTIEPSLHATGIVEAPLRTVEALAYWKLGDHERARLAASQAVDSSRNEEQRERVRAQVSDILK